MAIKILNLDGITSVTKSALVLFLGFIAGLIAALTLPLAYKNIVLYPTPANATTMVYQDKAGACFRPNISEVKCSGHSRSIPAQS